MTLMLKLHIITAFIYAVGCGNIFFFDIQVHVLLLSILLLLISNIKWLVIPLNLAGHYTIF